MSRVKKPGNKYVNTSRHDADVYETPKKVQIPDAADDYHKARTLTRWLYLKYDMSYKAFQRKSKVRRDAIRQEFMEDTGVVPGGKSPSLVGKQMTAVRILSEKIAQKYKQSFNGLLANIGIEEIKAWTGLTEAEIQKLHGWCVEFDKETVARKCADTFAGDWSDADRLWFEVLLNRRYRYFVRCMAEEKIPDFGHLVCAEKEPVLQIIHSAFETYQVSEKAFEAESLQQMYEYFCTYMENMRRKATESYDWRVVKLMGDGIVCGCQ